MYSISIFFILNTYLVKADHVTHYAFSAFCCHRKADYNHNRWNYYHLLLMPRKYLINVNFNLIHYTLPTPTTILLYCLLSSNKSLIISYECNKFQPTSNAGTPCIITFLQPNFCKFIGKWHKSISFKKKK